MKLLYESVESCKECPYMRMTFENNGAKFICNKNRIYLKESELEKIYEFCTLPEMDY